MTNTFNEEFKQKYPLVSNLIDQATYFLGVKNESRAKIVNDLASFEEIIVNPMDSDSTSLAPQLIIKNPYSLEMTIQEYLDIMKDMSIPYTKGKEDIDYCIFNP